MVKKIQLQRIFGCLVFLFISLSLDAQRDTAAAIPLSIQPILLPEVNIVESRTIQDPFIRFSDVIRVTSHNKAHISSVAQSIAQRSHFYVRQYGPGSLATVSGRGNTAAQTNVTIEGINIQNPTLGLTDLSLLPSFLFTGMSTKSYESNSINFGQMGSDIHLFVDPRSTTPVEFQYETGSFGKHNLGIGLSTVKEKYSQTTRLFGRVAKNNYRYRNIDQKYIPLANAQSSGMSGISRHQLKINQNHRLDLFVLMSFIDRAIPPTRYQQLSNAHEQDHSIKASLKHIVSKNTHSFETGIAYLSDQINYDNPAISIFSKNKGSSLLASTSWKNKLNNFWTTKLLFQGIHSIGKSDNYRIKRVRNQLGMDAQIQFASEHYSIDLNGSIQSVLNTQTVFIPTLNFSKPISQNLQISARIQKNFRFPSLDDLFWYPGGNPQLKPELGWTKEIELLGKSKSGKHRAKVVFYHKNVRNWIIWTPQSNQIWSPENISRVSSKGLELDYSNHVEVSQKVKLSNHLGYTYTKATDQNENISFQPRKGKQLIYTPMHQIKLNNTLIARKFNISMHHRWVSSTFADPLNNIQLSSYILGSVQVFTDLKWGKNEMELGCRVDNIWNNEYEIIKNYPLPGRGLTFQINIKRIK